MSDVKVWSCGSDTSKAILSDATLSLDLRSLFVKWGKDGEGEMMFLNWRDISTYVYIRNIQDVFAFFHNSYIFFVNTIYIYIYIYIIFIWKKGEMNMVMQ